MALSDLVLGGPAISETEKTRRENSGEDRRTLKDIAYYPEPDEIYKVLMAPPSGRYAHLVDYKSRKEFYWVRDTALVSLIYLLAVRISELLRLKRDQFIMPYDEGGRKDAVIVRALYLSKRRYKDKPRLTQYRDDQHLPLNGPRAQLTMLVINYLQMMDQDTEERKAEGKRRRRKAGVLFNFKRQRGWQITEARTGATNHWFRAFGETYLYEEQFGYDILATADYIKVDPRTLGTYIRKGYRRHIKEKGVV